ncbi:MAG TPA: hypothetical protein VFP36_08585 [Usitatibacter sp.]|nr:hypothetical protein [Usitatibacter sp.]
MDRIPVLAINLVLNTLIFALAARMYLLPRLAELPAKAVLLPILLLHSTRHLGLMFLSPGATYAGMPAEFAQPAAYGDLVASLLAVASIAALTANARIARPLLWLFTVEGSIDLVDAIFLANVWKADAFMGPSYWIPAFWVPALLVTHYIVFRILLSSRLDTRRTTLVKNGAITHSP